MMNHETNPQASRHRSYKLAIFAVIGLLPLGMGARGCDYAVVGNDCADGGTGGTGGGKCATGCLYDGKRYAVGEGFKSSDGCNQCGCQADGQAVCTLVACDGRKSCGGLTGAQCAKAEYCDFAKDAQCGAADQTGTCKERPQGCREISQPVCGCDDKTYGNACEAAVAGVSVAKDGACAGSGGTGGKGGGSGGSSGGTGCDYLGKHFNIGDSFNDSCNSCSCTKSGVVCTDKACPPTAGTCGGLLGTPCGKSQYCSFPPDAKCGAADQAGTCVQIPSACTKEYKPVCGCDGKTYGNACTAAAAGISVSADGECSMTPTGGGCDYNGTHYDVGAGFPATDGCNKCSCMDGGNVGCTKIACPTGPACGGIAGVACKKGEYCNFPPKASCGAGDQQGVCTATPQVCTDIYAPVCGCDDKTYPSACTAAVAGVSVLHDGACSSGGGCDYNRQHYNAGDAFPSSDGCNKCSCQQDGSVVCTLIGCSAQICGGFAGFTCDGDQYCNFPLEAMCGIADASGTCAPRPQVCDTLYSPVCGCDSNTYSNECVAAMKGTGVRAKGACK